MAALGPVAAYEQAVANMEAARVALDAEPRLPGCGHWPSPLYDAFLKACAARDEARRNLGVDAMDSCDRPFLREAARDVAEHPPIPPSQAFPD